MKITALASGSKGNAYFLSGESKALLIDAGLSARQLRARMAAYGLDETKIAGILLTHEHSDHMRGADVLGRSLGVPVVGTGGTLAALQRTCTAGREPRFVRCTAGTPFSLDGFFVEAFSTSHDAADPCGYLVREGDLACTICTDTGLVTEGVWHALNRADMAVLESNHCPEMLACGPYPEYLKRRIRSHRGHLSNIHTASCLQHLTGSLHAAMLGHLSEVNNSPDRALHSAREGLGLFPDAIDLVVAVQDPGESDHRRLSV